MNNNALTFCFLSCFLATVTAACSAQTIGNPTLTISSKDNRTISVSATGHAEADPDVADLQVGFVAYGPTLKEAYSSASMTSNAITKAMIDSGATKEEIQSVSQRVSRLSDFEIKQQKGMRFSVTQSWTVSVAPKDAAMILDAAVQAGANQSGDITWRLKNELALDTTAIQKATESARAIAAELARSMGVTLGKPIYATNSVQPSGMRPNMMAEMAFDKLASPRPLSIEAQRVSSNAAVEIVFAIE